MNFNLAHIFPKNLHGLNGYKEVIETIQWGLQELGHTAEYGLNFLTPRATNIIFGVQMANPEVLSQLPHNTIIYNFEQMKGLDLANLKPQFKIAAQKFEIWDYSENNVEKWLELGATRVRVVPIGYAPVLQRIPKPSVQDIDVLIYGLPGQDRMDAFYHLSYSGLTTVFLCGMYGKARDELIGRSKLIVNINLYEHSNIFEIVRVSYLLANQKAVVADINEDTFIDDDMLTAVKSSSPPNLVDDCRRLIENNELRNELEIEGYKVIQRRDIRLILDRALAKS